MNTLLAIFTATTVQLNLPPGLLASLCFVETRHNVNAIHYADGKGNSLGVCQIKRSTAQYLGFDGTEQDLMDPETNIYYAGLYLRHHIRRYQSINRAVIAYNLGHAGNLTYTNYQVKVFKVWRGE
jgi:soluble lytic murein transglycosylase-like protein